MNNDLILSFGVFFVIYGIGGLCGIQMMPDKYRGKSWSKSYTQFLGKTWILLGVPWIAAHTLTYDKGFSTLTMILIIAACSLPAAIYALINHRKYKALLNAEDSSDAGGEDDPS